MEAVKFECPHCRTTVDVEATSVGEVVACPVESCGHPFEAVPPEGHALDPIDQRINEARDDAPPVATENLESTLYVRHPAMLRRRPLTFVGLWTLVALGVVGLLGSFTGLVWSALSPAVQMWGSLALLVVSGATLLVWWVRTIDVTLTVTTERTTYRTGILSKQTTEVLHDDVRNLQLDQTVVQRVLGVGDIAISSSGQDDLEIVAESIPRPDEVVATIRKYQLAG